MMFFLSDEMPFSFDELLLFGAASGGKAIEDTATGNPLVFLTDLARPLKSLSIPFTPIQTGSGDPSPSNIRQIVPWDGLTLKHGGKNLLEYEIGATKRSNGVNYAVLQNHGVSCKGTADGGTSYGIDSKGVQLKSGKYAFSVTGAVNMKTVFVKDSAYWFEINGSGNSVKNLTADATVYCYMSVANGTEVDETVYVQIEAGETATPYEEYKPITETDISFPSTVYGGTLDAVTGVLTVTWEGQVTTWGDCKVDRTQSGYQQGRIYFDNPIPVSGESGASGSTQKCNIAKYQWDDFNGTAHFYTAIYAVDNRYVATILLPIDTPDETEIVVIAKLKTTQTVQLTPEQITAHVGNNTIWSDADGSMTAVFFKKA